MQMEVRTIYIYHNGITANDSGDILMSFGPNDNKTPSTNVGFAFKVRRSTTDYPVPTNLSKSTSLTVNKHSFAVTRGLGKILPYQGCSINCVNMSSLSLWLNGIPNIGIHPFLLHYSVVGYNMGVRPDLFSYYFQY